MSKLYDVMGNEITIGCMVAHASTARGVGLHVARVTSVTAKRFKTNGGSRAPECALVIGETSTVRLGYRDRERLGEPCENCNGDLGTVLDEGVLMALGCDSCGAMYDLWKQSGQRGR